MAQPHGHGQYMQALNNLGLLALCLLNQLLDFDQICIETLLEGGEELVTLTYLQGHGCTLKCTKYGF